MKNSIILIAHRVNKIKELKKLSTDYGVEIDVRNFERSLILSHDPFKNGERLD